LEETPVPAQAISANQTEGVLSTLEEGETRPTEAPGLALGPLLDRKRKELRKIKKPAQDNDGEKKLTIARSAREGTVDTAAFASPVLRETIFGHTGAESRCETFSADLVAPRRRDS
jgi:hypothetical protein